MSQWRGLALLPLLWAGAHPAAAQSAEEARAFVSGLYAAYATPPGPDYLGPGAAKVYTPRLLALIRRDQKAAKNEVGALDGDPICDCQDYEISEVDVAVEPVAAGRTRAVVRFKNMDQRKRLVLDLQSVAGAWRIGDVRYQEQPTLVRLLSRRR